MKIDNLVKYASNDNNCYYSNKYKQLSSANSFNFTHILLVKGLKNWVWIVNRYHSWFYIHYYNNLYFLNGNCLHPSILEQSIFDAIDFIDDNCCFKFDINKLQIFSDKQVKELLPFMAIE